MNNVIHVLDNIPGTRKTSGAIDYINNNPSKPILYICEYKTEIERVCDATHCIQPESVYEKESRKYHSKKDDIKKLLVTGTAIATSHALFLDFDKEILSVIKIAGYEIILDEVVDAICDLRTRYNGADYTTLTSTGHISTDSKTGKITWMWDIEKDSAYDELRDLCEAGVIYKAGNKNKFLHLIPMELFTAAKKVTVMTYNFKGSNLYSYLKINGFEIEEETEIKSMDDTELKQHIKEHVVICRHKSTDKLRTVDRHSYKTSGYTFSYSSYNNTINSTKFESSWAMRDFIKNKINAIYRHINDKYRPTSDADSEGHYSSSELMYTLPMEFSGVFNTEQEVKGKLIKTKKYLYDSKKTIKPANIAPVNCFVPLNCRGTNEYKNKAVLIHCYNQFLNPCIKSYYQTYTNITINEAELALNTLIQWIFRSRIRTYEEGKKIYIYLLSERMENILQEWLDSL